jgi:hypothetical protein
MPPEILRVLHLPSIYNLKIDRLHNDEFHGLLDISPAHIHWMVHREDAATELQMIFEKYTAAQVMIVPIIHMKNVLEQLADVRQNQQGMTNLKRITFVAGDLNQYPRGKSVPECIIVDASPVRTREELLASIPKVSEQAPKD